MQANLSTTIYIVEVLNRDALCLFKLSVLTHGEDTKTAYHMVDFVYAYQARCKLELLESALESFSVHQWSYHIISQ